MDWDKKLANRHIQDHHQWTAGKIRGLEELSRNGFFLITAMDQRDSMRKMVDNEHPEKVSYEKLESVKIDLASIFGNISSGILLDPEYGAAQSMYHMALPGSCGLLVSLEETGYTLTGEGRKTTILPGWSVAKIKMMGASGVKLLAYYNPDEKRTAKHQLGVVKKVGASCRKYDIPFVCEPMSYAIGGEKKDSPEFAKKKADMVIKTAKDFCKFKSIDLLKAEFPGELAYEPDEEVHLKSCMRLDKACGRIPWVVLSAGVGFDEFKRNVIIASKAGASGFLAGRALWKDSFRAHANPDGFRACLEVEGAARFKELESIVMQYGTPWYEKIGGKGFLAAHAGSDWYKKYHSD